MTETPIPYASQLPNRLTASDIFGVVVRTIGLLIVLYGLYCGCYAIYERLFSIPRPSGQPGGGLILFGLFYLGVGGALLRGGWIVRLAYGGESNRRD